MQVHSRIETSRPEVTPYYFVAIYLIVTLFATVGKVEEWKKQLHGMHFVHGTRQELT